MRRLLLLLLLSLPASAQISWFPQTYSGAPTGACNSSSIGIDVITGNLWTCLSGAWVLKGPAAISSNVQVGTTYTVASSDLGKLVTFSSATAVAITLPQCGTAGITTGWFTNLEK